MKTLHSIKKQYTDLQLGYAWFYMKFGRYVKFPNDEFWYITFEGNWRQERIFTSSKWLIDEWNKKGRPEVNNIIAQ